MIKDALNELNKLNDSDELYYVCYGSNLSIERLRCYFSGEGNEKLNVKRKPQNRFNEDPNFNPIDNQMVKIKYPLFFAKESGNWKNRGVAFLDKDKYGQGHETIGRAYKMSKKHFMHLWNCEGKSISWYGHLLYLGELNRLPMFSFTNEINIGANKPDPTYFEIIKVGLDEMINKKELNKEDANKYMEYLYKI